jgi:CRP-like cAMP-binding protein
MRAAVMSEMVEVANHTDAALHAHEEVNRIHQREEQARIAEEEKFLDREEKTHEVGFNLPWTQARSESKSKSLSRDSSKTAPGQTTSNQLSSPNAELTNPSAANGEPSTTSDDFIDQQTRDQIDGVLKKNGTQNEFNGHEALRALRDQQIKQNKIVHTTWYTSEYVLTPPEWFTLVWDWLVLLLTTYNTFMLPIPAFFQPSLSTSGLVVLDYMIDLVFLCDILLHFNTAYTDEWGILITNKSTIVRRYLKTNFLLDIISISPFEVFGLAGGLKWGGREIACMRLHRVIRVHRLKTSERLHSSLVIFRLLRLLVGLFVIVHWIGSIFYGIGVMQTSDNQWTGPPWTRILLPPDSVYTLEDADVLTQYMTSVYWAVVTVLTVGYGDITPKTNPEKLYTCLVIMIGAIFYAIVFGNIALLIQNLDISYQRYRDKLDKLEEFIKIYRLESNLADSLRATQKALWNIHKGIEMNTLIDQLPASQRTEVRMFLHQNLVESVPWFKKVSPEFIRTLVTRLTTEIYLRDEFIFRQGQRGDAMYFLSRGRVKIYADDPVTKQRLFAHEQSEGTFFGEVALVLDKRRTANVVTLTHCEICVLSKQDFFDVLSMFPKFAKDILITAHKRHNQGNKKIAKKEMENEKPKQANYNEKTQAIPETKKNTVKESPTETITLAVIPPSGFPPSSNAPLPKIQMDDLMPAADALTEPLVFPTSSIAALPDEESSEDGDDLPASNVRSTSKQRANRIVNESINSASRKRSSQLSAVQQLNRTLTQRFNLTLNNSTENRKKSIGGEDGKETDKQKDRSQPNTPAILEPASPLQDPNAIPPSSSESLDAHLLAALNDLTHRLNSIETAVVKSSKPL